MSRDEEDVGKEGKELCVAQTYYYYCLPESNKTNGNNQDKLKTSDDEDEFEFSQTLIDHSWSRKILELIGNKAKLLESFSWLSTVGGGYSALGERDSKFSMRAGCLSLGQQLRLAELLGDERLKVMCHLFAALAALQMDNRYFCLRYIKAVIIPLINSLPYRDPILTNILQHICFRMRMRSYADQISVNSIENGNKNEKN